MCSEKYLFIKMGFHHNLVSAPNEKKFCRNRGIQWYAKPQFRLVFINRGSQTVYSVFINHQLPRHENTAILDAEKNRINGLTSAVVVHRCVVC